MLTPGQTFIRPSGTERDPERKHLFVVLTAPCENRLQLLVPVSSIKAGVKYDNTCELSAGCHPFITVDSFVFYRKLEQLRMNSIVDYVNSGYFISKPEIHTTDFNRIEAGVETSPFAARGMKRYFAENS